MTDGDFNPDAHPPIRTPAEARFWSRVDRDASNQGCWIWRGTVLSNGLADRPPLPGNAARTECVNGHEFSPENTYMTPDGRRQCIACRRVRSAVSEAKRSVRKRLNGKWVPA